MKIDLDLPRGLSPDIVKGYCLLWQLESWFRELVYLELKSHYGLNWWTQADQARRRSRASGIPAETSLRADKAHPHMSTPENDPLWYLSFDSLLKIIFDRKLWPLFKNYLTTKSLVKAKFEEIRPIRNRIAHSRSLHRDDLNRIEVVLRDLDQGFWKFCTSYNHDNGFIADLQKDPVYKHFSNREHVPWAEVEPNKWARVGIRLGVDLDMILGFSIRPSQKRRPTSKISLMKGAIYDFTFSIAHHHDGNYLEYSRILTATQSIHDRVLHIFLDSFQKQLRITFPAVIDTQSIIDAIEKFYEVCLAYKTSISYRRAEKIEPADPLLEYEEEMRPFEQIAAAWPHYVVPPSHPFTFLCPDMPCNF